MRERKPLQVGARGSAAHLYHIPRRMSNARQEPRAPTFKEPRQ